MLPAAQVQMHLQTLYNEITIMQKISTGRNAHVITLVGYIVQETPPAIVMEYAPFGNLYDFLSKFKDEVRACNLLLGVHAVKPV